jgi:amino acid transporter
MPGRKAAVVGIAVGAVTFSCLIHGTWRRGGILLNNFIASIKVLIICIFPVLAVCALAGVKHSNTQDITCMTNSTNCLTSSTNAITSNFTMAITHPFDDTRPSWYGWSNAFLSVIFAYDGVNQANYVSSRINHCCLITFTYDEQRRSLVKLIDPDKSSQKP